MIIGKADKKRIIELRKIRYRISQADRWLAEITELQPMWDYILGKRVVNVMQDGSLLETMAEGDISQMRDKLRKRFK